MVVLNELDKVRACVERGREQRLRAARNPEFVLLTRGSVGIVDLVEDMSHDGPLNIAHEIVMACADTRHVDSNEGVVLSDTKLIETCPAAYPRTDRIVLVFLVRQDRPAPALERGAL